MTAQALPRYHLVQQHFPRPRVADLEQAVRDELQRAGLGGRVAAGQRVAVAVGSRGIRGIERIVAQVVRELRALGAEPLVVPAMGSHGGGTAEGQRAVLAGYGISEQTLGCPVRSDIEPVELGRSALGFPVLLDRHAAGADRVLVVNRVKPHTMLSGPLESGVVKMCLIGLGKPAGARIYHRAFADHGWMAVVQAALELLLAQDKLCLGLGIVQNAHEDVARLRAMAPDELLTEEPKLLEQARGLMGRLPFADVDLLVVDHMGKDISGTGMDTNITGRKPGSEMRVERVFVRGLTERTHGNAQGIGLADFTTRALVDSIDMQALYLNSRTANRTDTCKIPMTLETDREVLQVAAQMAGYADPATYCLVWVPNTLELGRIGLAEAYLERIRERDDLELLTGPQPITFDEQGALVSPFSHHGAQGESP